MTTKQLATLMGLPEGARIVSVYMQDGMVYCNVWGMGEWTEEGCPLPVVHWSDKDIQEAKSGCRATVSIEITFESQS